MKKTVHLYRCLQLLKALHNKACRWLVLPIFYSCLMLMMVFSAYASIRFYDAIPLYLYVMMPVMFVVLLTFCLLLHYSSGSIFEASSRFIIVQRRYHVGPKLRRVLKSFYPLRVQVGATYFITSGTVTNFMNILVTTTATLLLAFP